MRPHNYETPEVISIKPVLDYALEYNPMLATRDITTVTYWVAAGCDIEKDILPQMKKVCAWKKGVSSFNYFTKPIMAARDLRQVEEKRNAEKQAIPVERLVQAYQWKRERGLPLTDEQNKILNQYEAR